MSNTDDPYFVALLEDNPEKLYDRAPCGYLTTDGDGTIRKVNETFLDMTGHPIEALLGRRFPDFLPVGGRIYYETHLSPLLHLTGTAKEIALDLLRADGRLLPVLVNAVAERVDGAVDLVRIAVFDATQRRGYERELFRAKERAEASEARARTLARTLQQTLIPPAPPTIPGLDVGAAYRPAGDGTEVGGDFYDVFRVADDDWMIAVGDVCGKDAPAAAITALARYTLRAAAMDHRSPAAVLHRVNDVMLRSATERFCTVVLLRLHREGGTWQGVVGTAGHPLPLLRSAADGAVVPVGRTGRLLGVLADPLVTDVPFELAPGDLFVMYTDGIPEARQDGTFYGDRRMHEIVAKSGEGGATGVVEALVADAVRFQGGVARDDIAVVAVGPR